MDRETILQKARGEKDERAMAIEISALGLGGKITLLVSAFAALLVVVDGAVLGHTRVFDYKAAAALLVGIGALYVSVSDAYLYYGLRSKRKLVSAVLFGCLFVFAAVKASTVFL